MKKLLCSIFLILMVITTVACGAETEITSENFENYFSIQYYVDDIVDGSSIWEPAKADLHIKISSKKNIDIDNVSADLSISITEGHWRMSSPIEKSVNIPASGELEFSVRIQTLIVNSTNEMPDAKISVTKASGIVK